MDAATVKLSIIIPVYNQVELTRRCVESIVRFLGSSANTGIPTEVVIVDNGSFDETRKLIESLRTFSDQSLSFRHVLHEGNLGFAKGANAGARIATGEFLLFLNNDTEIVDGTIPVLVRALEQNPGAGIAGCRLLYHDNTIQHAGMACDTDYYWHHVFRGFPAEHPAVLEMKSFQAVTGACILISRQLFVDVGEFDEGYLNSYEDVDLCLKVGAKGKTVLYVPQAVLYHYEGMSHGRTVGEDKNRVRFLARWRDSIKKDYYDHTEKHLDRALSRAEIALAQFQGSADPYRNGLHLPDVGGGLDASRDRATFRTLSSQVIMVREGVRTVELALAQKQLATMRTSLFHQAVALMKAMVKRMLRALGLRKN